MTMRSSIAAATMLVTTAIVVGCDALTAPKNDPTKSEIVVSKTTATGRVDLYFLGDVDVAPLVTSEGKKLEPSYSPDGATIAFYRSGGNAEISVVNADGSGERTVPITSSGGPPSWSPDGQWIVYPVVVPSTQRVRIDAVHPDGSGAHTITAVDSIVYEKVSWSKSGRIAFVRTPGDERDRSIWSVGADGSGLARITSGPQDVSPRWSPDGSLLAFTAYGPVDAPYWTLSDAMLTNADGTGRSIVTGYQDQFFNKVEAWSRDGEWLLVFRTGPFGVGSATGSGTALYKLPLLGGLAKPLTPGGPGYSFSGATWR